MSSLRGRGGVGVKPEESESEPSDTSSSVSTDSSSDSDDSSTVGSSGGSGSSNSSTSSATKPPTRGARPSPAKAETTTTTQQQQQQQQQQRYVHLNPDLRFERPDNEYIPLPPLRDLQQAATVLRRISVDKQRYPEGRHRMLDYFRVAVEMFVTEVRVEYRQQFAAAQRNGRAMQRFTWKNNGELAICFACCCDMLKLLYDSLQPGPLKPMWDVFVNQLAPLLIVESRVPSTILSEQTYHVKYMDWQKGGTRYAGEQHTANVRFPSAADRRLKIETYLKSGAGFKLAVQVQQQQQPQQVAAAAPAQAGTPSPPPPSATAGAAAPRAEAAQPPFAGRLPGSAGVKVPVPPGAAGPRAPVKVPVKQAGRPHGQSHAAAAAPPLASVGVKQMPPEMKHLFWLSVLAHVKGGEATRAFPDDRLEALPGLLRLCEMTEESEEMLILIDVLAASSAAVQTVFERLGGLLSLRRFASHFIQHADAEALMRLVEMLARCRISAWRSISQQAWLTDMNQKRTPDLVWLRSLPFIPELKGATFGALLVVMEQRFIFRAAFNEDATGTGLKRPRIDGAAGDLSAVLSDCVDMQKWVVPRVNVFSALRLPLELRVPPLCPQLEKSTVDFLNAKRTYATTTQEEWRDRIEKVLAAKPHGAGGVRVPVFYDPYELLGMCERLPAETQ